MSNENQAQTQYVISENLLQEVLNILGELPLKNSLNTYLQIQQTVHPLKQQAEPVEGDTGSKGKSKQS